MRFNIKLLHWPDAGHYALVIAQGLINMQGFVQIVHAVSRATEALPDCKVVIDFEAAEGKIGSADIDGFVNTLGAEMRIQEKKMALVSGTGREHYADLIVLSSCLTPRGFNVAVFHDAKDATAWLSE